MNLGGESADLGNCPQQGRLSAAALTDDAEHLARVKADADVLDHGIAAVSCGQVVNS